MAASQPLTVRQRFGAVYCRLPELPCPPSPILASEGRQRFTNRPRLLLVNLAA